MIRSNKVALVILSFLTDAALAISKTGEGANQCPSGQIPLPPLGDNIAMFGAAVFQSKLYVVGGTVYAGNDVTSVKIFDGMHWSPGPDLPFSGESAVAAAFQSRLYVFGSQGMVVYLNGTFWNEAPPMPRPRYRFAAAVLGSKLYVLGDQGGSKLVDCFDGAGWSEAPPLPSERDGLAAVSFEGKLYAIGGEGGTDSENTVRIFDGTRWMAGPPMHQDRSGLVAAVFNSKLYALGGMASGVGGRSSVEVFDGRSWALAPSMTTEHSEFGVGVLGSKLYVVGGDDTDILEQFDGTSFSRCTSSSPWKPAALSTGVPLDASCEMVEDIAFVNDDVYTPYTNTTVPSAAECCAAAQKAGLDAWTFDPRLKAGYNCMMMPIMVQGDPTTRTEARPGVTSGSNGRCSAFTGSNLCVVGTKTACCDGAGSTLGEGQCYDPGAGSCCQNDLQGIFCSKSETCCTYEGEDFEPVCCNSDAPYCINTTKTGEPSNPQCAAKPLDPVPPADLFPWTFHTWLETTVTSGDIWSSNVSTVHTKQLVTYDEQNQWSCRTDQQNMLHRTSEVPEDFCIYSTSGGNHSHRTDTAKEGGCSESNTTGEMPGVADKLSTDFQEQAVYVGVEEVAGKKCHHWTLATGSLYQGIIDFWATTSKDNAVPCRASQNLSWGNSPPWHWELTTWLFDGFNVTIPPGRAAYCKALQCGSIPGPTVSVAGIAAGQQTFIDLDLTCPASALGSTASSESVVHVFV